MGKKRILVFLIGSCLGLFGCERSWASEQQRPVDLRNIYRSYCGVYSMSVILKMLGVQTSLEEVAKISGVSGEGVTFKGLLDVCRDKAVPAVAVRFHDPTKIRKYYPAILKIKPSHMVALADVRNDGSQYLIVDVPHLYYLTPDELSSVFTGEALIVGSAANELLRTEPTAHKAVSGTLIIVIIVLVSLVVIALWPRDKRSCAPPW